MSQVKLEDIAAGDIVKVTEKDTIITTKVEVGPTGHLVINPLCVGENGWLRELAYYDGGGRTIELVEKYFKLPQGIGSVVRFDRTGESFNTGGVAVRTGGIGWLVAGRERYHNNEEIRAFSGLKLVVDTSNR